MAIVSSGTISIHTAAGTDRSITGEFGGTAPHALSEYYRGGANVPSGATGVPASGTIALSDFYGAANTFATTYHSSIDAYSFSSDSNVDANIRWRVFYSGSDIKVQVTGGEEMESPSSGDEVYRITNAPSGYTVRHGTFTHNEDIPDVSGTITSTATSIPTAPSDKNVELRIESGGGFDDPGQQFATGSGSLIFEKSGSTTFTYSFSYSLEAETEGSGGE